MVSFNAIKLFNQGIKHSVAPRVAVFVGATSGIGQATLAALAATDVSVKIYLIGRKSSQARTKTFAEEVSNAHPKAHIIWTEADVSLLADTRHVCDLIQAKETQIDLLFMSAGYAPFSSRTETSEGIEVAASLEYYSRILLITQLLPLLSVSSAPRVVSVLAGGKEAATLDLSDLDLKRPGSFSGFKAQVQYATMMTASFDRLALENPQVTFIHSFPGWVNTGNMRRGQTPIGSFLSRWIFQPMIAPFCLSIEESAQRYLFQSTSGAFGGHGVAWEGKGYANSRGGYSGGLFLVDDKCECSWATNVLPMLRGKTQEEVWSHTHKVLGPYLHSQK